MSNQESPQQEAISIISIAAILVAVVAYAGAVQNVPFLSLLLYWVAVQVYNWFPTLNGLHSPQLPMLVSAAAVGAAFWVLLLPFSGLLAQLFNSSQIGGIERQTYRLKRNRARIQKSRRDKDSFDAQ
jgi:ABC-type microcin C transport system permease subunit YejB